MDFNLAKRMQLLNLGQDLKVKVRWNIYRQDDKGNYLFETTISNTSGQVWITYLKPSDLKHLGHDFTKSYDSASSWIPINGKMVLKCGAFLSQDAARILREEMKMGNIGRHINAATMGQVLTPSGDIYPMTANGQVFNNTYYRLKAHNQVHIPIMPNVVTPIQENRQFPSSCGAGKPMDLQDINQISFMSRSEVPFQENRQPSSSSGAGKPVDLQDPSKILWHAKLDGEKLSVKWQILPSSIRCFCEKKLQTTGSNVTTATRVPVKDATRQKKKMDKGFSLAEYKKNISAINRVKNPYLRHRFICEICGWGEDFKSKMDHHYLVHKRKGNGSYFCGICIRNFRSKKCHLMRAHQIKTPKCQLMRAHQVKTPK